MATIYDDTWLMQRATTGYPLPNTILNKGVNYSFILDAKILVPVVQDESFNSYNIQGTQFYLSKIIDTPAGYIIQISYSAQSQSIPVGKTKPISRQLQLADYQTTKHQRVQPIYVDHNQFPGLQINLVIGDTKNYTAGTQSFTLQQGRLDSFCRTVYTPIYTGIKSINGLVGDVNIVADAGIKISVDQSSNTIRISRQLYDYQEIKDAILQNYVKTINGIGPDSQGNVKIKGSDCVQIVPIANNALSIVNPCGKPCCDAVNTNQQVAQALQLMQYQKQLLKESIKSMANGINFMQANLAVLMGS